MIFEDSKHRMLMVDKDLASAIRDRGAAGGSERAEWICRGIERRL
jgi:hypothetical protein